MPIYSPKNDEKMKRKDMLGSVRQYLTNGATMVMVIIDNTPSGEKIEQRMK